MQACAQTLHFKLKTFLKKNLGDGIFANGLKVPCTVDLENFKSIAPHTFTNHKPCFYPLYIDAIT
jgi:hypothetical protein